MTAEAKEKLITEIIDNALGGLSHWSMPVVAKSIGPNYPELAQQFSQDLKSIKQELYELLSMHSVENLKSRYIELNHRRIRSLRDPNGIDFPMVAKIVALTRREPAWFIAGWHIKELELDVPYWRAFSRGNLIELTLMSVGLDPRRVGYDALFKRYGRSTEQDTMLYFLEDQYQAIANGLALDPDQGNADVDMEEFYRWAKRVKFRLDDRFRRMLRNKYGGIANNEKVAEEPLPLLRLQSKTLHKSRYNFHAQLFYAMAVEKFGGISPENLGSIAKKIQLIAELQGQTPSVRPIKQLLTKGHELRYKDE